MLAKSLLKSKLSFLEYKIRSDIKEKPFKQTSYVFCILKTGKWKNNAFIQYSKENFKALIFELRMKCLNLFL